MWTRTSFVWNFFKTSEDHPERAQCLYCKKTYRDNSHAAMKQHITDFHNTEYISFMDRKKREALEDFNNPVRQTNIVETQKDNNEQDNTRHSNNTIPVQNKTEVHKDDLEAAKRNSHSEKVEAEEGGGDLRIIIWNANGLTDRREELELFMNKESIDVALISETKLKPKSQVTFLNYTIYRTDHPSGNSQGGTAVVLKNHRKHYLLEPYKTEKIQATSIKLFCKNSLTTLAAIYCPPQYKIDTEEFKLFFDQLGTVYICGGDWNSKHTFWGSRLTNRRGKNLYKAIQDLDLEYISHGEPTYWPADLNKHPDLLDFYILRNFGENYLEIENCRPLSSDHTPVILNIFSKPLPHCTSHIRGANHPTQTRYEGLQLHPGASGNSSRQDETSNSGNSNKRISKLIVRMIVLQNLPFNFVEGGGFRELLKDLAPKYNLENSEVFKTYMVDIYDQMKIKVKREIIKFLNLSITAHIRKDCKSNKFVILLISHGITETFKRSSILLKCSIIDNIATEDEVGKMINTIAYELDFPNERVHCMIRDELSSSQRGTQSVLSMHDLDCAFHKIQNIIRETFLSQENITNIPTNITNNFPNALNELEKILDKLNVNETGFVDIIKKFCFIFTIGTTVVVKYGNFDTHLENQMEQSAYNVVKLLLDFINCERSQQHVLSSVIPTFKQITESLEEYLNVSPESNAIKAAVSSLKTGFETALSSLENNKLYAIATFLDPRYKNHFSREVKIKICRDLSTTTNVQSTESHRIVDSFEVVPPKRTCIRLNDLVNDTFKIKESDNTIDLRKEINDYGNIGALNVDEDPLEWWKNNGEQFKSLSKFARRFLSPPAVSVVSEQLFEGDGSLELTLNTEEDAKLLFVKHNAEMFGFDF